MHPLARTLRAYAIFTLVGFAVLAVIASVSGYREQAAPQQADFVEVAVAPGGLRLYGVGWGVPSGFSWGWRQCDGGHVEHSVGRTGDTVEVALVFRPSPHLGACAEEVDYDVRSSHDGSMFIPLEGPPPTTVTAQGDSTRHAVIDPDIGPVLPFDTGWEATDEYFATELYGSGASVRSWTSTTSNASVDVIFSTGFVGQPPDAWVRTGEIRLPVESSTGTGSSPSVDAAEGIRLVGQPAVARLEWKRGKATVDVSAPDGRVVLTIRARAMTTVDVLGVVRSIAAANP